jgi:hypothetical protein
MSPDASSFEYGFRFCLYRTAEKTHRDAQVADQFGDIGKVLLGQDFGGRHEAGLVAVVDGHEHGHQGHDGFAAAYVALHEAVHLLAGG